MSGCNECKFCKTGLNDDLTLNRKCLLNKDKEMNKWWEDNGAKTYLRKLDNMECHEYRDSTKKLIEIKKKLDLLGDLISK